jgi:hypothetical protein
VQTGVNFRVTSTAEKNALLDLGNQLIPPSQDPALANLETLGCRVTMMKTVSRGAVAVIAANLAAASQHPHE